MADVTKIPAGLTPTPADPFALFGSWPPKTRKEEDARRRWRNDVAIALDAARESARSE